MGESGDIGGKLGLSKDWIRQVIVAVGNYGGIFEHNPLLVYCAVNNSWTQGDLLYAMPFC